MSRTARPCPGERPAALHAPCLPGAVPLLLVVLAAGLSLRCSGRPGDDPGFGTPDGGRGHGGVPCVGLACRTADQGRLPRSRAEGDMPSVAVAVGDYDAIECVLRNIGIDKSEFSSPNKSGAVHLYDNESAGGQGAPEAVNVRKLVTSLDQMLK